MPDDDERPRDASGGADFHLAGAANQGTDWAHVPAPDDIRELSRDIKAYRRELRATRRQVLARRLMARPGAAPLSMIAAVLFLTAIIATMITVMVPGGRNHRPAPLPLAHSSIPSGQPGSALPLVSLQDSGGDAIASNAVRPAVLALIPLRCNCQVLLDQLAAQAYSVDQLPLIVVAPSNSDAEASALAGRLIHGNPSVYYDTSSSTQSLATRVGAQGLTVILLDRDGTVYNEQRSVTTAQSTHLHNLESTMLAPTSASG